MKLVARVKTLTGATKHVVGLPPELTEGIDLRTPMPDPTWLVIEHRDNGYFLFRYTDARVFAGDTWHESLKDAYRQAKFEYELEVEDWIEVPEVALDPLDFVAMYFGSRTQ